MTATDLTGRTIVITGAARGLGAAIAHSCHAHGASVILTDVLETELEATTRELGERASWKVLDVTDPDSWQALADHLVDTGVGRPDGLVNNAGIVKPADLADTPLEDFRRALDVNVVGPFLGSQMYVRLHQQHTQPRPGSIVNIASVRGLIGANRAAGYTSSKFGVRGLTKGCAVELGPMGIRVNAVCPGPIESDMSIRNPMYAEMDWDAYVARLPLGRLGQPLNIGEAVAWLVSDASEFVTGIDLPVDGGLTATSYSVEPRKA
jgi:3alpha(or 20beta)-hydroxysteroid dehydrogenase